MIAQFAIAVTFLTRLRVGRGLPRDAKAIAKSARWFPLVGALLGGIYGAAFFLLTRVFPPLVTGVAIVIIDAWLTGAIHFDGLADTADGFGGGRTREDVLRIMRDHAIGSYGAVAIGLALALKIAAITTLSDQRHAITLIIDRHAAIAALLLAPVLGRWSAVVSGSTRGYARATGDVEGMGTPARFMGCSELAIATTIAIVAAVLAGRWKGIAAMAIVGVVVTIWGWWCGRRIGGVTGDTLGAGVEISECAVLLWFAARWT